MGSLVFPVALLCLAVLPGVSSLEVTVPKAKYEYARGDNITLPCTFKSKLSTPSLVIVSWTAVKVQGKESEDTLISTHYSHTGRTDYNSQYERRAKVEVNVDTGKADLKLFSITMGESRDFECMVQIPGDDEGTTAAYTEVVVLVAPSTPICKIEGKAEYGQDIKLTCHSEEGSPTPSYEWESRDVRNMPRMKAPKTTDQGGVLSLFNITKETSGYYICTSKNKIRSATCNVTLAVMPPSMMGSVGMTAGIIAGVVGALLIGIIVIYCCCCKKKKGKDEEYAMGVQEYLDKEPALNGERQELRDGDRGETEPRDRRDIDGQSDYDDRRSDYTERRDRYDEDRRDRRYDDDRDRRYDDDRDRRYDDDRDRRYDDDRDRRYDDDRDARDRHYDDDRDARDRRYDDDRDARDRRYDEDRHYDEAYDDRPPVPNSKPPRRDYDD